MERSHMLTGTLAVAPSMIQQPGQSSVFFGQDGAVIVSMNVTQEEVAAVVAFVGKLNMGACVAVLLAAGLAYERERYDKPAHTAYEFVAHTSCTQPHMRSCWRMRSTAFLCNCLASSTTR